MDVWMGLGGTATLGVLGWIVRELRSLRLNQAVYNTEFKSFRHELTNNGILRRQGELEKSLSNLEGRFDQHVLKPS